jgi:hypothetical protein
MYLDSGKYIQMTTIISVGNEVIRNKSMFHKALKKEKSKE